MQYVVLLRYGLWSLHAVLKLSRAQDGSISCIETLEPFGGMTWWTDGRYRLTSGTSTEPVSQRVPLASLSEAHVAYSMPGPRLLDERVPGYASGIDQGATVQVSAHAVLEEPDRVELQLVLVPRGQEPYHRETVGDRRIDDGDPDIWIVLARFGDEPAERLVARRILRWPPPLRAETRP
jgi:hypothetical protein